MGFEDLTSNLGNLGEFANNEHVQQFLQNDQVKSALSNVKPEQIQDLLNSDQVQNVLSNVQQGGNIEDHHHEQFANAIQESAGQLFNNDQN